MSLDEMNELGKSVHFVYEYPVPEGEPLKAEIDIQIPMEASDRALEELMTALLNQMDPMLRYMDENIAIIKALRSFIMTENQKFYDETSDILLGKLLEDENFDVESVVNNIERRYKEELLQFADRVGPTDEDIFAQSFHRLVHSSSLEEILRKERDYAKVIAQITAQMESEVDALNNSQQEEMESTVQQLDITTTTEDVNKLLAEQYSIQSYVRKRFESELEAKRGHQRNEYRQWITSQVSELFQMTTPVTTPLGNRSSMFITQQPSMEESFTIHLGSQLKHMHNIRILSANINDLCSPLHDDESLNGMNMALGLYSSSLCGVVVLTPAVQVKVNEDIVRNANMSTEFHFDQIEDQLEKIEERLREQSLALPSTPSTKSISTEMSALSMEEVPNLSNNNNGGTADSINNAAINPNNQTPTSAINSPVNNRTRCKLKTGDFFITKHSNLLQSHVIFHLVTDETINSATDINSRHEVILGLRNILKTASRHDVSTLTIPVLLRHEMTEDMTVPWCIRRAELVFKCAKGFMIESASWGGAELSTLQLLLPHNISEELFNTLANMVPSVFRLANPKILVDNKCKK